MNAGMSKLARLLLITVLAAQCALAGEIDVKVTAVPKTEKDDSEMKRNTAVSAMSGYYKVTLKNQSLMNDVPDLTVQYRIFHIRDTGMKNPRDLPMLKESGDAAIPAIKHGASTTFETTKLKLYKKSLNPNFYYTSGAQSNTSDTLEGIWLKVFHGDELVSEFAIPASLMKTQKF